MEYPRPQKDTLVVEHELEVMVNALLNYAEDKAMPQILREDESSLSTRRRYNVVIRSLGAGARESVRHSLGAIRLSMSDGGTEIVVKRYYWGDPPLCEILNDDSSVKPYLKFLDQLTDTLVARYRAVGERVINYHHPSEAGRVKLGRTTTDDRNTESGAGDILPTELHPGGKYGRDRDLTFNDVCAIVAECRDFIAKGGKVPAFYEQLNLDFTGPRYFALETLRNWLKQPKFTPKTPRN